MKFTASSSRLWPAFRHKPGVVLLLLGLLFPGLAPAGADEDTHSPWAQVNPMVGTAPFGHTYPGATVPFGMVQVSPDTRDEGWEACSGYDYDDTTILGFSHTHLMGTGDPDLGDVLLMPTVGKLNLEPGQPGEGYKSRFSHNQESAQPGYYKVFLQDPRVTVELTATTRVGMQRYTFPDSSQAHVIIDTIHGLGCTVTESNLRKESSTVISGHRKTHGWAANRDIWFVIEFFPALQGLRLRGRREDKWQRYRGSLGQGRERLRRFRD